MLLKRWCLINLTSDGVFFTLISDGVGGGGNVSLQVPQFHCTFDLFKAFVRIRIDDYIWLCTFNENPYFWISIPNTCLYFTTCPTIQWMLCYVLRGSWLDIQRRIANATAALCELNLIILWKMIRLLLLLIGYFLTYHLQMMYIPSVKMQNDNLMT